MPVRALDTAVSRFVEDVTEALLEATAGVDGADRDELHDATVNEAFNLATAMVDADERHTTDELEALLDAFGHRLDATTLRYATSEDLRGSSLVVDRRRWLEHDSQLFGILADADAHHGTHLAERYYERALDIAHVVASLDVVPSAAELAAISTLRTRLLAGLRQRAPEVTNVEVSGVEAAAAADRAAQPEEVVEPDPPARPLEELLAELDELVGLDEVKARVHLVADLLQVQKLRAERGLPTMETSHHLVFTGNPGTGKTTVARLLSQIYRTLGVVERGHLVEVDRSGLVAGFVGQTAPRVTEAFDRADEGMLFIDEAYTLARGNENDFGREAIDQIVKLMEDRRDRVVLVVAGYPAEMDAFLSTNPGLRSRFPTVIDFPDYSTDEIVHIVDLVGAKQRYVLTDEARERLRSVIDAVPRSKGFGNARVGRNLFEAAVSRHASRVVRLSEHPDEVLTTLTAEDVPDAAADADTTAAGPAAGETS